MLEEVKQKLSFEMNRDKDKNVRPKKIYKKPEGMHRELYSLIRSDNCEPPPILVSDFSAAKYKTNKIYVNKKKKVRKWVYSAFKHPERQDSLALSHWQRLEDVGSDKPYPFAKFNKHPYVPYFTAEDYDKYLLSQSWTMSQTQHLMDLARTFNINFTVMFDRWDRDTYGAKTDIEALKERYFDVYNALAKVRSLPGTEPAYIYYDAAYERRRKQQLTNLWNRTPEQIEEEKYLIQELKKIEARKKERERRTQDLHKLIGLADSNLAAQCYRKYGSDAFEFTNNHPPSNEGMLLTSPHKDLAHQHQNRLSSSSFLAEGIKLEEMSNSSSINYNQLDMSSEETCSNYSNINSSSAQAGGIVAPSKKIKNSPLVHHKGGTGMKNPQPSTSKSGTLVKNVNKNALQQIYQQAMFDQSNFTGIKFSDYKSSGVYLHSNKMKLPLSLGQKKTKALEQALAEIFSTAYKPSTQTSLTITQQSNISTISDPTNKDATSNTNNSIDSSNKEATTPTPLTPTSTSANRYSISYYNHPYHPPATEAIVAAFNNLRSDLMLLYELKAALTATEQELQYLKMYKHEEALFKSSISKAASSLSLTSALIPPPGQVAEPAAKGTQENKDGQNKDKDPEFYQKMATVTHLTPLNEETVLQPVKTEFKDAENLLLNK